jgi:hypothetical protein
MRSIVGSILAGLGTIGWTVTGLWAFILCLSIVNRAAGFWDVVIGFGLAPVTFIAAPWYAFVAHRETHALVVGYGGSILFGCIRWLGNKLAGEA